MCQILSLSFLQNCVSHCKCRTLTAEQPDTPFFLATSSAMYSGWILSVHRGKCSPCSSTLPMGKITTAPSSAAFAASLVLNSSSHRGLLVLGAVVIIVRGRTLFFYLAGERSLDAIAFVFREGIATWR